MQDDNHKLTYEKLIGKESDGMKMIKMLTARRIHFDFIEGTDMV